MWNSSLQGFMLLNILIISGVAIVQCLCFSIYLCEYYTSFKCWLSAYILFLFCVVCLCIFFWQLVFCWLDVGYVYWFVLCCLCVYVLFVVYLPLALEVKVSDSVVRMLAEPVKKKAVSIFTCYAQRLDLCTLVHWGKSSELYFNFNHLI